MVQLSCDFEARGRHLRLERHSTGRLSLDAHERQHALSSDTGPSRDHTTGSGYYIYTKASDGWPDYNKLRRLESPLFSLQQDASLSFFYQMYGSSMGTLSIEAYGDGIGWSTLWSRTGDQGNAWRGAAVVLPASTTRVRINGVTGNSYRSDMALDDVSFSQFRRRRHRRPRPLRHFYPTWCS